MDLCSSALQLENKDFIVNLERDLSPVSESGKSSLSSSPPSHPYSCFVSRGDLPSCHHFLVTSHQGSLSVKFNLKTSETIQASLPVGTLSAETLVGSPGTRLIPSTTVCSGSQVGCSLHMSLCYWSMNAPFKSMSVQLFWTGKSNLRCKLGENQDISAPSVPARKDSSG